MTTQQQIKPMLEGIGLSEKEADVYMCLLEKGTATIEEVMKETELKRGVTYNALYKLKELDLLTSFTVGKKVSFSLAPPHTLSALARKKQQEAQLVSASIEHLVPQLQKKYKLLKGKPTVQYYEGEDGLREALNDLMISNVNEVFGCIDLEEMYKSFPSYAEEEDIPSRKERNIFSYALFTDSTLARKLHKRDSQDLRETHLINGEKYPIPAQIDVYGDKVAMFSFQKGDFIGIILQNEDFATSLRSVFRLAMDGQKAQAAIAAGGTGSSESDNS
jgi:sugar-specific transcriptional regulator TrmB